MKTVFTSIALILFLSSAHAQLSPHSRSIEGGGISSGTRPVPPIVECMTISRTLRFKVMDDGQKKYVAYVYAGTELVKESTEVNINAPVMPTKQDPIGTPMSFISEGMQLDVYMGTTPAPAKDQAHIYVDPKSYYSYFAILRANFGEKQNRTFEMACHLLDYPKIPKQTTFHKDTRPVDGALQELTLNKLDDRYYFSATLKTAYYNRITHEEIKKELEISKNFACDFEYEENHYIAKIACFDDTVPEGDALELTITRNSNGTYDVLKHVKNTSEQTELIACGLELQ